MTDTPHGTGTREELRIGQLSSGQVDDAGRILAQAFLGEKMFNYLLCDDDDRRLRATIPVFEAMVRAHLPYGGVHSAMLGDKLVGAAVRLPPEHNPLRGRENVYLKRGFSILKEFEPMPGGPTVWTMWRDPASAEAPQGSIGRAITR
jgi:hypothetical protein